jgi:hypothetical protein
VNVPTLADLLQRLCSPFFDMKHDEAGAIKSFNADAAANAA